MNDAHRGAGTTTDSALHHRLLADVHDAFGDRPQPKPTFFAPLIGNLHDGELKAVGLAVNGWLDEFDAADCGTEERRQVVIDGGVPGWDGSPVKWVTDHWGVNEEGVYNPKRSAFWRVIQQVLAEIGINGDDWSSHLAWTNLYRVSPAEGGNPSEALSRAQRPACIDLIRSELAAYGRSGCWPSLAGTGSANWPTGSGLRSRRSPRAGWSKLVAGLAACPGSWPSTHRGSRRGRW